MAGSTRYWVVERDADGDCIGDYESYRTTADAYRAARSQRLRPHHDDTATIEVGRIVNHDTDNEYAQVLRTSTVVRS